MNILKKLLILTALMALTVAVALPPILGAFLRSNIQQVLTPMATGQSFTVSSLAVRSGWFHSDFTLSLSSEIFSDDGLTRISVPATLQLTHGPIIWHLYDSPFALASIQLIPGDTELAPPHHFSGSGLVQLDKALNVRLRAITGFTAFAGDHWLDIRANWPVTASRSGWRNLLQNISLRLNIDADALAIAASPAADALVVYQRQGWTWVSNGRAQTEISLQNGELGINGRVMPVSLFLGQPTSSM